MPIAIQYTTNTLSSALIVSIPIFIKKNIVLVTVMMVVEALMVVVEAMAVAAEAAAMEGALQVSNPLLLTTPNYCLLAIV